MVTKTTKRTLNKAETDPLTESVAGSKPSAKDRILEAAEAAFASHGFYGTSMRAVADAAGVDSYRTHYYFGSKDELLRQVLLRRVDVFMQVLRSSLDAALAKAAGRALPVEALVEAWVRPSLELALSPDKGWQHYQKLQYQLAGGPQKEHVALLSEHYRPVYELFIDAFAKALPGASLESIKWAFHCIEQVSTRINNEDHHAPDFPNWRVQVTDIDAAVQKMVTFYAAGFYALASRDYVGNVDSPLS